MIELTPAVVLSMVTVLAVLGTKIWSLGGRVEGAATRDQLNAEIAALRREIGDKSKESVDAHQNFARRSDVLKIEQDWRADLFNLKIDLSAKIKEMEDRLNERHKEMLAAVTGLAKQVTAEISERARRAEEKGK